MSTAMNDHAMHLDAAGVYYRELNEKIRAAVKEGVSEFVIDNIKGQRYIGTGLKGHVKFRLNGTPGQDLGAFMSGPEIFVHGNVQDGVGNTMDAGTIAVDGIGGDVLGYGMRGGTIHVRGDVGYRVGIHMKAYKTHFPVLCIGGKAGDFLGEYMAGGAIILLGMFTGKPLAPICGRSLGTGMHGGTIFIRGEVPPEQLSFNLAVEPVTEGERKMIAGYVQQFCDHFKEDVGLIMDGEFNKVTPISHRPYGKMYVHA